MWTNGRNETVKLQELFAIDAKVPKNRLPPRPIAQQPLVGQGLLVIEASRFHSDTPHSVGLLWASDRPGAETST